MNFFVGFNHRFYLCTVIVRKDYTFRNKEEDIRRRFKSLSDNFRFMEKTVRILEQSALSTRKYTDKKTGQEKVMNAVTFKLTDGIDTFLGEVTGERAVNCPMYDKNYFYRVQCSMVVRDWLSQQTGEQMQATTIYIDRIALA